MQSHISTPYSRWSDSRSLESHRSRRQATTEQEPPKSRIGNALWVAFRSLWYLAFTILQVIFGGAAIIASFLAIPILLFAAVACLGLVIHLASLLLGSLGLI